MKETFLTQKQKTQFKLNVISDHFSRLTKLEGLTIFMLLLSNISQKRRIESSKRKFRWAEEDGERGYKGGFYDD